MRLLWIFIVTFGWSSAPVAAQEPVVDPEIVQACFEDTAYLATKQPACIGDAMTACMDVFGTTTVSQVQCAVAETTEWDRLLNVVYQEVRPVLADRDLRFEYDTPTAGALLDAQRAWIAFRDAECTLQWAMYQDGTIRGPIAASCRLHMTAQRVFELRALLEP